MRLKSIMLKFLLFFILVVSGDAQVVKPLSTSAKLFEKFLPKGRIVTAELREGKVKFSSAGTNEPIGIDPEKVLFEIGSTTKIFTGLLLAQAVVEKRVSLDSTLQELLPNQKFSDSRVGKITLHQLAIHASGLPCEADDLMVGQDITDPYSHYDRSRLYAWLGRVKLEGRAPFSIRYSNFGMGLLGDVLAQVYQKSWEDLVLEKVTRPLGMKDTCVHLPSRLQSSLARGFRGEDVAKPWKFSALVGAGGLKSTASDMILFGKALLEPETTPLADAIRILLRSQNKERNIGLAIALYKADGQQAYGHDGGTHGYSSVFEVLPKQKSISIILINNSLMSGRVLIENSRGNKTRYERYERVLTQKELMLYEGIYSSVKKGQFKGLRFVVVCRDNKLFGKVQGTPYSEPFLRLYPDVKDDKFFLKEVEAQYQFFRKNGKITTLNFIQGGVKIQASRVNHDENKDTSKPTSH